MKMISLRSKLYHGLTFRILLIIMIIIIMIYPEFHNANVLPVVLAQQIYAVSIGTNGYLYQNLFIIMGSAVTWANNDQSSHHTVTSGKGPNDPIAGHEFDSHELAHGQTFSYIFNKPGSFDYFDKISGFHGRIIVR